MTAGRSADLSPLVSRNAARERVARALHLHVGRGKRFTVRELSIATGVKARLIECAMVGPDHPDCRPLKICELLSIASFLGADFTSQWLVLADQGAFALPAAGAVDLVRMAADSSEDNALLTRAAASGATRDLHGLGERLMARGAQIAAVSA